MTFFLLSLPFFLLSFSTSPFIFCHSLFLFSSSFFSRIFTSPFFFYVSEGKGQNFLLLANELLRTIMEMVPIKEGPNFILFSEYKKVLIDYSNIINFSYKKTIHIYIYIFFSSMCHSRCCPSLVGQPSVPSSSSFLEIMMNKDFWGFFFSSDKLSVALNDMVLGRSLWIYQEDSKGFLGRYVYHSGIIKVIWRASSNDIHTLVGCI